METSLDKQIVEEVRAQWKRLWLDRIDDKVRAEGISSDGYPSLFVEKGLVIFATRGFQPLSLREILCQHGIGELDRLVPPDPSVGGWGKFVRNSFAKNRPVVRAEQARRELEQGKVKQQLKKGGRGWLHV